MKNIFSAIIANVMYFKRIITTLIIGGFMLPALVASDREEELRLERWMAAPFSEDMLEYRSSLESWMTVPFDAALEEVSVSLESWMAVPFDAALEDASVSLEPWMSVPFVEEVM